MTTVKKEPTEDHAVDNGTATLDDHLPPLDENTSSSAPPMEESNLTTKTAATVPTEEKKESFMQAAGSKALRPFVIISSSYLLFTITDGAIRMIVLLHAYNKNFSALEVAIMFTLYELAGVFTNLAAGVMGARWGIKFTLICGLTLQLISYALLFAWKDEWTKEQAIIYVTFAQMFAGIAKDLTKLGGKTVTKLVTPDEQDTKLFKLVSLITGWKNSLKGVGYFLGSALLQVSYEAALASMMGLVLLAMPWAILGLDRNLGTAKKKNATWSEIFVFDNRNLNWLSLARLFLFASRDFWFEVPLPFFLRSPSCEGLGTDICTVDDDCTRSAVCGLDNICENINVGGGCGGLGVQRVIVGAFLGGYIILYGQVQSWTPQLVTGPLKQTPPNKLAEILWGYINCLPTLVAWIAMSWGPSFQNYNLTGMTAWIIVVVITFAVIFAINSSIHSYLVVNYASKEKVAVSVGFYYMSNAVGRLFGTLGSGFLYTFVGDDFGDAAGSDAVAGLAACFLAGTLSSFLAATLTFKINDNKSGLKCGSCCTIVAAEEGYAADEEKLDAIPVDRNTDRSCPHCQEYPCVWKRNEARIIEKNNRIFSVSEGMTKQANRRYFAKRQMATILGRDPSSVSQEQPLPYCCYTGIRKHWPN
jgi:Major Facilitator Superfamily